MKKSKDSFKGNLYALVVISIIALGLTSILSGCATPGVPTEAENTPPTVSISSPSYGSTYTQSNPITFTCSARDPEDGDLAGDSLVWISSKDGKIGSGNSFTRDDLSAGSHTITLGTIDSQGTLGTDSVSINIEPEPTEEESRERLICEDYGKPCDDGDPCTVNDTLACGRCFGQVMECKDGEICPDNKCRYYRPIDPEKVVTLTTEEGETAQIPVNQMLLEVVEGTPRDHVNQIISQIGGIIVGQIPEFSLYQIELPTSTVAELDAIIRQLASDSAVNWAGYHTLISPQETCTIPHDNLKLKAEAKCAFADIEYSQGLTIYKSLKSYIKKWRNEDTPDVHPYVYVAVIEGGGVNVKGSGNFNQLFQGRDQEGNLIDCRCYPLNIYAFWGTENSHAHSVTSVIAADNDGKWMNGLASGILDDGLFLLIGSDISTIGIHENLMLAGGIGTDIVNLSITPGHVSRDTNFLLVNKARKYLERIFLTYDKTLFIVAAPNRRLRIDDADERYQENEEEWFEKISRMNNIIVVGGTSLCDPTKLRPQGLTLTGEVTGPSAWGPAVFFAAPSEFVPTFKYSGEKTKSYGNSFAAPMVTSLAAVIKYIYPSLTPLQIKELILGSSWTTAFREGDEMPKTVPSFARAIATTIAYQAIRYRAPEVLLRLGAWESDVPPALPPGLLPAVPKVPSVLDSGRIMTSICGARIDFEVKDIGRYTIDTILKTIYPLPSHHPSYAIGDISVGSFGLGASIENDASLLLECKQCQFRLGNEYSIGEYNEPGAVWVKFDKYQNGHKKFFGYGKEGKIKFNSCEIYSLHKDYHSPYVVAVEGSFMGVLEMHEITNGDSKFIGHKMFSGNFVLPFEADTFSEQVCSHLEEICKGGFGKCLMTNDN